MNLRIMGLDLGERRIGVAVSDPLGWIAQGITTIVRGEGVDDIQEIIKLVNTYDVEKIVVGLPKNMNNTLGPQGEKAIEYARVLKERCEKPIVFFDERLSTVAVQRTLIEADVSRAKRKKVIDKLAASYILQSYLDCNVK